MEIEWKKGWDRITLNDMVRELYINECGKETLIGTTYARHLEGNVFCGYGAKLAWVAYALSHTTIFPFSSDDDNNGGEIDVSCSEFRRKAGAELAEFVCPCNNGRLERVKAIVF